MAARADPLVAVKVSARTSVVVWEWTVGQDVRRARCQWDKNEAHHRRGRGRRSKLRNTLFEDIGIPCLLSDILTANMTCIVR